MLSAGLSGSGGNDPQNADDLRWRFVQSAPIQAVSTHHTPVFAYIATCCSYALLLFLGAVTDWIRRWTGAEREKDLIVRDGYAPLVSDFASSMSRHVGSRAKDLFHRQVMGVPGRMILLFVGSGEGHDGTTSVLNFGSYNYLGFSQTHGPCADVVQRAIERHGVSATTPRLTGGTTDLHQQAEAIVARFLGQEAAILVSMGFAGNVGTIAALTDAGCLIISDELNHSSIRTGSRLSGAQVCTFRHNDMLHLELVLRQAIALGQPVTGARRPWKKIIVVVEGIYSMEGTFVRLPEIVSLKKRYKFFLYLDEAHSIGSVGKYGRGILDYFHLPASAVDVMMGTLSKSFGAAGGYIAGSRALIERLRLECHDFSYAESMAPPVLAGVVAGMNSLMEPPNPSGDIHSSWGDASSLALPHWMHLPNRPDGQMQLQRLAFNCRYLARGLRKLGFMVTGSDDSPVVCVLVFNPGKMAMFSRMMLERRIAIVVIGFPATHFLLGRIRFCLSAFHSKADVDTLLRACNELGGVLGIKYGLASKERWSIDDVVLRAAQLVEADK